MKKSHIILQNSGFFAGIPASKYDNALRCLRAQERHFPQGSMIAALGERAQYAGVLLEGTVEELLYDECGNQVTIKHIQRGEIFGAELACTAKEPSQVCLCAISDCDVLLLDFETILSPETMQCPYRMQVTANLMRAFSDELRFFNCKIRILAQKRLRDRLRVYLKSLEPRPDGSYNLPFTRSELAEYLCVDRSALSRELCRLRDEGVLTFSGTKLFLRDKNFLDL